MVRLPVSSAKGVITLGASVVLPLKKLVLLVTRHGQTLGNEELADETMAHDGGGLTPVWKLQLEFCLNHLAEIL